MIKLENLVIKTHKQHIEIWDNEIRTRLTFTFSKSDGQIKVIRQDGLRGRF